MYTYNGMKLLHGQGLFAKISEHNETTEIDVTKKRDPDQLLLNGSFPGLFMRSILPVWQQVQLL